MGQRQGRRRLSPEPRRPKPSPFSSASHKTMPTPHSAPVPRAHGWCIASFRYQTTPPQAPGSSEEPDAMCRFINPEKTQPPSNGH